MTELTAPNFTEQASAELWQAYFSRIEQLTKPLAKSQQRDVLLEIRAHLLESMLEREGSESERVKQAQSRLGDPQDFVPGWVQERLAQSADPSLVLHSRWQLLRLSAISGVKGLLKSMLLGFGHMLVFYSYMMMILKPFFPENIGLFTSSKGYPFIGFLDAQEFTEHLGWWFIPVMFVFGTALLWWMNYRRPR